MNLIFGQIIIVKWEKNLEGVDSTSPGEIELKRYKAAKDLLKGNYKDNTSCPHMKEL